MVPPLVSLLPASWPACVHAGRHDEAEAVLAERPNKTKPPGGAWSAEKTFFDAGIKNSYPTLIEVAPGDTVAKLRGYAGLCLDLYDDMEGVLRLEHALARGAELATGDWLLFTELRRLPRVVSDGRKLMLDSAMSGDEPYMLASNLPDVAVLVDKNRVKSGRYAMNKLGCDTLVLQNGTPEDVRAEVRHRLRDLGPGGGFVFCSIHNIQAQVPPENIVAMYDTAREYGGYPIE